MARTETKSPRVAQYIEMCDFPCNKDDLLLTAEECQFPDDIIDVCEDLPNRVYESEDDVMDAVDQSEDYEAPRKRDEALRRFR